MDTQPYTVRFEYADGQHYDAGLVPMTIEQAAKVQEFLETLEKAEHISEPYVGEYREWETPFAEMLKELENEFSPRDSDLAVGLAWDALNAVAK